MIVVVAWLSLVAAFLNPGWLGLGYSCLAGAMFVADRLAGRW